MIHDLPPIWQHNTSPRLQNVLRNVDLPNLYLSTIRATDPAIFDCDAETMAELRSAIGGFDSDMERIR
jgi:hypothetical protein